MRPSSFTSITLLGLVLWLASMSSGHTQTLEWVTQAGGPLSDRGSGIAIDSNGNSYVTGDFEGSATFGLGEPNQTTLIDSNGLGDIFVAKYDPSGALVWVTQAGGPGIDRGVSIAVDSSGNSYVRGVFRQTATFGAITLTSIDGSFDIFVAKYDPNGALVWVRQVGGPDIDAGRGIAVDSSGNSYVVGSFLGTTSFGGIMLTSAGPGDIFVAKYNSSGTLVWVRQAGGTGLDNGVGIAVDSSGNSYVTGFFEGTASFGATMLTSAGLEDIVVAKYDPNGTLVWARRAGGTLSDESRGIAVDSSGNSYVTG
ncbi:MAG: SBBP repeat-containing protein, partial [Candidatus Binatia bacterium]